MRNPANPEDAGANPISGTLLYDTFLVSTFVLPGCRTLAQAQQKFQPIVPRARSARPGININACNIRLL